MRGLVVKATRTVRDLTVSDFVIRMVVDQDGKKLASCANIFSTDRYGIVSDCEESRRLIARGDLVLIGEIDD